jgi:hypothetical protein
MCDSEEIEVCRVRDIASHSGCGSEAGDSDKPQWIALTRLSVAATSINRYAIHVAESWSLSRDQIAYEHCALGIKLRR